MIKSSYTQKRYSIEIKKKPTAFIRSLNSNQQAQVIRIFELFETYGNHLPSRYLKKIDKTLWELRPGRIRLFLTMRGPTGHVVHAIIKKSQKIPIYDIRLAKSRIKKLL